MASLRGRTSPSFTDGDDSSSFDKLHVESPPDCEIEEPERESLRPKSWWKRILGTIFPGLAADKGSDGFLPLLSSNAHRPNRSQNRFRRFRFRFSYCLLIPTVGFFVML